MGVIIAKVFKKEREPIAPEFIAPTQAQQRIIKETWEVPKKNLTDSGELILFKFLDMFPKNQEKFPAFNNVPLLSVRVGITEFSIPCFISNPPTLISLRAHQAFERMLNEL